MLRQERFCALLLPHRTKHIQNAADLLPLREGCASRLQEMQDQNWRDKDENGRVRARMDFVIETLKANDDTGTLLVSIKPSPRRYTQIEIEGEPHYLDKFLKVAIPEAEIMRAGAAQLDGLPIFYKPPAINSASDYAESRKDALTHELAGAPYTPPAEQASGHGSISDGEGPRFLTFLSVDICGSSSLRRNDRAAFDMAYEIFLRELGTVVGHFHGSILKTTGDGFVAFVDFPAFTTQCDNTIDMGLTLVEVLHSSVNPALVEAGLPALSIRVGADYGEASVRKIEVPTTGFASKEIASDALNCAVKIEQSAGDDEFRIGRALYELIHVQWLERCSEVTFDSGEVGIDGYRTYSVR